MFNQRQGSNPFSYNLPSADPKMWAGSPLAQQEAEARALAAQSEDVDMEAVEYIAAHPEIEQAEPISTTGPHTQRYLTLDTNILLRHLPLVRDIFEIFSAETLHPISLLIPTTVISELDRKKNSDNDSDSATSELAYCAREATRWLLVVNRERRETGYGAIRCQRWSERGEMRQSTPDEKIVDCAQFFSRSAGAEVIMWTDDNGLAVLAEAQDGPTICPTPTLSVLLEKCRITLRDNDIDRYLATIRNRREAEHAPTDDKSDDGMQIETDLFPTATPQPPPRVPTTIKPSPPKHVTPKRTLSTSTPSTPSSSRSPPRRPTTSNTQSYLPSRRPPPPPPPPQDKIPRLTLLANLILSEVQPSPSPSPPPYSPSTPTTLSTQSAFASLEAALNKLRPPGDEVSESTRSLYRLLATLQTLSAWVRPAHRQSQVLSGEAAKALEGVLEVLPEGGVYLADEDQWWELVSLIRAM